MSYLQSSNVRKNFKNRLEPVTGTLGVYYNATTHCLSIESFIYSFIALDIYYFKFVPKIAIKVFFPIKTGRHNWHDIYLLAVCMIPGDVRQNAVTLTAILDFITAMLLCNISLHGIS
jgi:hypothetical protein